MTVNDSSLAARPAGDFRNNGTKLSYAAGDTTTAEYQHDGSGNLVRDLKRASTKVVS